MRRSMRLLSMAARAMVSICVEGQPAPAQRPWFALLCNDGFCGGRAARGRVAIKTHSTGRWTVRSFRNPAHRGTSFAQQRHMEARKRLVQVALSFYIFLTHPSYSTDPDRRDPATAGRAEGRSKFPAVDPCKVSVIRARAASVKLLNNTIFSAPVVGWSIRRQ